jgi:hypothetical protein
MNLAEKTRNEIARLLDESGWQAEFIGCSLRIHPLDLELTCDAHEEEADEASRCVIVTARHNQRFPQGITEHCIGYGDTGEGIAASAAEDWVTQPFSVIHELLCGAAPDSGVQVMDLITRIEETDEIFAWKAYLSPMTYDASEGAEPDTIDQLEFTRELLGLLSGILLDDKLHWLKCFAGVVPGREALTECRFDGILWDEGGEVLYECASRWPVVEYYRIRKQFILFAPCELGDLKNGEELAKRARAVEDQMREEEPQ